MPLPAKALAVSLAAVALLPLPAVAQDSRASQIADQLGDPMTQYMVAGALAAMSTVVLDMNIEPMIRAMKSVGAPFAMDLPPDATLGDLAGPEAGYVPREVVSRVPRMMDQMGEMAGAFDEMLPEIEAAARRMRDELGTY